MMPREVRGCLFQSSRGECVVSGNVELEMTWRTGDGRLATASKVLEGVPFRQVSQELLMETIGEMVGGCGKQEAVDGKGKEESHWQAWD
jgi:hypothetical protein